MQAFPHPNIKFWIKLDLLTEVQPNATGFTLILTQIIVLLISIS